MINALSFDVEEYFHAEVFAGVVGVRDWTTLESRVVDTTCRLLDLLEECGTRATFFVLGWVAERHPKLIRRIASRGHEIASHGYGHQMITRMDRRQFREDVRRGKTAVEDASGSVVFGYRAPTFSVVRETLWSLEVLAELGFRYDSSIFPIVHDRYGMPGSPRFPYRLSVGGGGELVEFPLSTVLRWRWRFPVAGGGYFRLVPYAATRWAIRELNERERQPAIAYLHPWEIDSHQPRLPVDRLSGLRHSINTRSTEGKLRRLLGEFRFASVGQVLGAAGLLAGSA